MKQSPERRMDHTVHQVLRFGRFVLDLGRGCLRAGDQEIDLRPKIFEVLRYLANGWIVGLSLLATLSSRNQAGSCLANRLSPSINNDLPARSRHFS